MPRLDTLAILKGERIMSDTYHVIVHAYRDGLEHTSELTDNKDYMRAIQDMAEYEFIRYNGGHRVHLSHYETVFDYVDVTPIDQGVRVDFYFSVLEKLPNA